MTRASPAAARAEQALLADPRRTNKIIAIEARTASQWVGRVRQRLEAAGTVEVIPVTARVHRPRTWPLSGPRKAIEAGATTTAEVMQLAGCSYQAAWRALDRSRRAISTVANNDAAAAYDSLSVDKTRVITYRTTAERAPAGYYQPADPIEVQCFACTLEWRDGGWAHERSCPARRAV
jgi:hypothetical protein